MFHIGLPKTGTSTLQALLAANFRALADLARRNVLAALWAGPLIGLSGPALTAYAFEVHAADFQAPGVGDVADKIMADLHRAGVPARPSELRERLSACHRKALLQTCATD